MPVNVLLNFFNENNPFISKFKDTDSKILLFFFFKPEILGSAIVLVDSEKKCFWTEQKKERRQKHFIFLFNNVNEKIQTSFTQIRVRVSPSRPQAILVNL